MKVMIVKEVMTGDVSPVAMFFYCSSLFSNFHEFIDQACDACHQHRPGFTCFPAAPHPTHNGKGLLHHHLHHSAHYG